MGNGYRTRKQEHKRIAFAFVVVIIVIAPVFGPKCLTFTNTLGTYTSHQHRYRVTLSTMLRQIGRVHLVSLLLNPNLGSKCPTS